MTVLPCRFILRVPLPASFVTVLVFPVATTRWSLIANACTIVALASMVHKSIDAAALLEKEHGIACTVIDVRSLVPLDTQTILSEVSKTGRLFTVEENPRLCGWGAEIASIVADECFWDLDGPITRITTPHVPLPSADLLEDNTIPSVDRIVSTIRRTMG